MIHAFQVDMEVLCGLEDEKLFSPEMKTQKREDTLIWKEILSRGKYIFLLMGKFTTHVL